MDKTALDRDMRWVGWLVFAMAIVGSTYIAASSWSRVKLMKDRTISVTGSAKRRITSDLIVWDAGISTHGPDQLSAYKQLQANVNKTLEYLKGQGLKEDELRVSSVSTSELTETEYVGTGENRIERQVPKGFQTSQNITVSSNDVSKVERVSREVTNLIEQGVPVTSGTPQYYYTKLGDLKIEMLAEAAKDARNRGEHIVASGSARITKLRGADMGVININQPNSTATSWEGNNDTSTLEKDIITIVHCTYEIE